eukprot:GHVN01034127.1.p1 GENE.GHVN01034127.1~~GHVN01034127.1.p1  ORF type:complete len:529 (+),score=57.43 GHVN01034127.1:1287-2873(+)
MDLDIPAGKTTALVGTSGCGKSTVTQLLQRFYDLDDGGLLIDGRDIREYNVSWWRSQLGIVNQEPRLFSRTIRENIAYGLRGARASEDQIIEAAKKANAHDFIVQLPNGYDTFVGQGGGMMSGGQKQRIAIARAMLSNPTILILDEATSALDNQSEKIVQDAIDVLLSERNMTTIIIAHRLSTIRRADKIVVLANDGNGSQVVEQGSHTELFSRENGLYRGLVEAQSGNKSKAPEDLLAADIAASLQDVGSAVRRKSKLLKDYSMYTAPEDSSDSLSTPASFNELVLSNKKTTVPVEVEVETEKKRVYFCGFIPLPWKKSVPLNQGASVGLGRLYSMLRPEWYLIVFGCICAAIAGSSFPLMSIVMSNFVDVFFSGDIDLIRSESTKYSLMFVGIGVGMAITSFVQAYSFGVLAEILIARHRQKTFTNLMYQDIAFYDKPENNTGYLAGVLAGDCALTRSLAGDNLSLVVQNISTLLAGIIISFSTAPKLAAVTMVGFSILVPSSMLQFKLNTMTKVATDITDPNVCM